MPDQLTNCEACNAPLSRLVVGGVGDWRDKIMCEACMHIKHGVHAEKIAELVALQYGITPRAARQADDTSQREYERVLAGGALEGDLPASPTGARWHVRRLAARV